MNKELYDKLLGRLKEIREYEWNAYDLKIHEECLRPGCPQRGVRDGETALEAIARNMVEVIEENLRFGTQISKAAWARTK